MKGKPQVIRLLQNASLDGTKANQALNQKPMETLPNSVLIGILEIQRSRLTVPPLKGNSGGPKPRRALQLSRSK